MAHQAIPDVHPLPPARLRRSVRDPRHADSIMRVTCLRGPLDCLRMHTLASPEHLVFEARQMARHRPALWKPMQHATRPQVQSTGAYSMLE